MRTSFALVACLLAVAPANAQIDLSKWGAVVSPVYGTSEAGVYHEAELFAGPNKFGSYFTGVLPNGRIIKPAGVSVQVGMTPLSALTPDGRYLITTNDHERNTGDHSLIDPENVGGHSLTVVDTATMKIASHLNLTGDEMLFVGLRVSGAGPYQVWASGGSSNCVRHYAISTTGVIAEAEPATIPIAPLRDKRSGSVSSYAVAPTFMGPTPSGFSRGGATLTCPAGSDLSPDGRFLYVACQGDNSVAVIDTAKRAVVKQLPAGYSPYGVSVSREGATIFVANWGMTDYKFAHPIYDSNGDLTALGSTGTNEPDGYYVPKTDGKGPAPKSSSISIFRAPGGDGSKLTAAGGVFEGRALDLLRQVGDTHPSATALVRNGTNEILYVAKPNVDAIGLLRLGSGKPLPDFDLSPIRARTRNGMRLYGAYPNALAASPDGKRVYVAEGGLNSVAVLDSSNPIHPKLIGRYGTGWWPGAVAVSPDGRCLYVANIKGVGEDINPRTDTSVSPPPSGLEEFLDSNFMFGTVQKIDLSTAPDNGVTFANSFAVRPPSDTSIVPVGGAPSSKIAHVIFILHENKTLDSVLGSVSSLAPFTSMTLSNRQGVARLQRQYTGLTPNLQTLAKTFATSVNYYSDADESDAGHQFASSGTGTDHLVKTLYDKDGRGLQLNKNMEPEDYPASGYLFNNAARNGVSFKDYGDLIRIAGTDTGASRPSKLNDPPSGRVGYPKVDGAKVRLPLEDAGDVDTETKGLGQSYFLALPILGTLGTKNANGEPRLDHDYPGYNFNISDQRRAKEFIRDFDRMSAAGTLPKLLYVYLPNDHTGGVQAPNAAEVGTSWAQQIADGDVGEGMIVQHILKSRTYYDPASGKGAAIFITFDDAQSGLDHIDPHRTPLVVVSPYAKRAYAGKRHYSTASIVKTEELLLGLPPNNLGDLFATDLRDMFQPTFNGVTASSVPFTRDVAYHQSPEGKRIWSLVNRLDTDEPDESSRQLGALARLSRRADELHDAATASGKLKDVNYVSEQKRLYDLSLKAIE